MQFFLEASYFYSRHYSAVAHADCAARARPATLISKVHGGPELQLAEDRQSEPS
jgi:hypothetical protein